MLWGDDESLERWKRLGMGQGEEVQSRISGFLSLFGVFWNVVERKQSPHESPPLVCVATSWGVKSIALKQEQAPFLSDTVGFSLVP